MQAPTLVLVTLAQLEGADHGRSFTFDIADDERTCAIEIHLPEHEVVGLSVGEPRPMPAPLADAALRAVSLGALDDDALAAAVSTVLLALVAAGWLRAAFVAEAVREPAKPIVHLWKALKPAIERFSLAATLDELASASGLSGGQIERRIQGVLSAFGVIGIGIRSVALHVRMKTAVYFLGVDGAAPADVATVAGYGSVDAMGRAFRDAGLPPPREVQRKLRDRATV
jgi:hypothetical protein